MMASQGAEKTKRLTREEMERRRLSAAYFLIAGHGARNVATLFNVSATSVYRWKQAMNNGYGLHRSIGKGRPPRLKDDQKQKLIELFQAGPEEAGFAKWTFANFSQAAFERIGIKYHKDHLGRILRNLGLRTKRMHNPKQPVL